MSGGENCGEASQDASASNNGTKPGGDSSIYENRGPKKIIRLITVMAYVFSVSFVAMVLSAYYLFLWDPPNPRLLHTSRFSGEPGVQYLQAHPSFELTGSHDDKYPGHFVVKSSNRLANLQGALASAPANTPISDADSVLNKSLNVLRNSIIDVLRRYQNSSTNSLHVSPKNTSVSKNVTKNSTNSETMIVKTIVSSRNMKNSTFNNSRMPSAVKSAIISRTVKNVDNTTNRSALRPYGQLNETIGSRLPHSLNRSKKINVSLRSHTEQFSANETINDDPLTTPATGDQPIVNNSVTFRKKEDEHFPVDSVSYAPLDHDWVSSVKQLRKHPTEPEDRFAERSILSSRDSRSNINEKFLKETEMHLTQRSREVTHSEESQVENVMMRASPAVNEEEIGDVTTPQEKGLLLTLLIESTDTEKSSPSALMTSRTTSSSPPGGTLLKIPQNKFS